MDPLSQEEYRQLRAAIRERGSLKTVLFLVTMGVWAAVGVLVTAFIPLPLASLIPLILLASGFEAMHQLHIGAERIGRYLLVRYESASASAIGGSTPSPMWERSIAAFGTGHRPSTRPADALFSWIFASAVILNFLVGALGATAAEMTGIGAIHALIVARVFMARRAASHQRAEDQKRFEEILK